MPNKNLYFAILSSFFAGITAGSAESTLHFANGDSLSGTVLSLKEDAFSFQSDVLREETLFDRKQLLKISLPEDSENKETIAPVHQAIITLEDRFYPKGDRDQLKGELIGITDDTVEINTSYAGKLSIDRSRNYSLAVINRKHLVYSGPNSLDEWNELGTPSSWSFSNKSLITGLNDSSIAIELDFTTRSHLSFTVDKKKNIDLSVLLFADDASTENPSNYYDLTINGNYLNMRKYIEKGSSRALQRDPIARSSIPSDTLQYDIYADLDTGTFHIYTNGELRAKFSDPTPEPKVMGKALHFRTHRGYEMRIRDINLSKWNGTLPLDFVDDSTNAEDGENLVQLANGDSLAGEIGKTKEEKITIHTDHAEFDVPISAITSIHLSPKEENHPRADRYDLKAYFKSGGWIILDPISLNADQLVGNHEAIGNVTFDLNAFSKIEFNVYDRKLNKLRADTW
jgi:hypothetical protein